MLKDVRNNRIGLMIDTGFDLAFGKITRIAHIRLDQQGGDGQALLNDALNVVLAQKIGLAAAEEVLDAIALTLQMVL